MARSEMSSFQVRDRFVSLVCSGWSLHRAAAEVGMSSAWSVRTWRRLAPMELKPCMGRTGGVGLPALVLWPGASSDRPKTRRALSLLDRQVISVGLQLGMTQAAIGKYLGRCKSVISREIARHQTKAGTYHAYLAAADPGRDRPRPDPKRSSCITGRCASGSRSG